MSRHQLCRNCGHEVDNNYCPACGQRTSTHRLSWATLAESLTSTFIGDEAYGVRGMNMRKGAVGTWWAIVTRPSRSIGEFIEGHRRKYFNPVAILLLLSTLYAVVFALAGKQSHIAIDPDLSLPRQIVRQCIDYVQCHPAVSALVSLPFAALAMKTLFGRKCDLRYIEYFYIGIFLSVFEVTLMVIQLPLELLFPRYSSFYGNTLPVFVYTAVVFWRLFGLTKKGALLRTFAVDVLTYVYAIVTTIIGSTLILGSLYLVSPESFESYRSKTQQQETAGTAILGAFSEAVSVFCSSVFGEEDKPSAEPGIDIEAELDKIKAKPGSEEWGKSVIDAVKAGTETETEAGDDPDPAAE